MNFKRLIPVLAAIVVVIWWTQKNREAVEPIAAQPQSSLPAQSEVIKSSPETALSVTAETPSSAPELGHQPSKLAAVAGFGHNHERDEQQFSAEERQREELVADCMRAQGYEYTPTPSIVIDDSLTNDTQELERLLRDAANDPNDRYLLSLSETQRREYFIALTGVAQPNHPEAQVYDAAIQSNSCTTRALRAIPGVYAHYNQLRPEFEAMQKAIAADPKVVKSVEDWSACMSLAGFQYSHPRDLASLQDKALATGNAVQSEVLAQGQQEAARCDIDVALNEIYANTRIEHENLFYEFYRAQLSAPAVFK